MTSFLNCFKNSLEGKLEKNTSIDAVSGLTFPLDPATVEENISQVQEIIRSTFTKDVSFMEANKLVKSKTFYGVDFAVASDFYGAIFSISLIGRHFCLKVVEPDKADKKDNWMINGFPYLLTEENISKVIREAEDYFASHRRAVEFSKDKSEEKPSSQARAEVAKNTNNEQANIKENLRLKKLWQLQFLFYFLFMIAILALAIYMSLKE